MASTISWMVLAFVAAGPAAAFLNSNPITLNSHRRGFRGMVSVKCSVQEVPFGRKPFLQVSVDLPGIIMQSHSWQNLLFGSALGWHCCLDFRSSSHGRFTSRTFSAAWNSRTRKRPRRCQQAWFTSGGSKGKYYWFGEDVGPFASEEDR